MILAVSIIVAFAVGGGWLAGAIVASYCAVSRSLIQIALMIGMSVIAVWSFLAVPPHLFFIAICLGWMLLVLASIDLQAYRLPDCITFPLIAAGLLSSIRIAVPDFAERAMGVVAGYFIISATNGIYHALRGRQGLGLGDAKLTAAAGAWLGWAALPLFLLMASMGGLAWAVQRLLRRQSVDPLPFGIPLAGTLWLMWIFRLHATPLP